MTAQIFNVGSDGMGSWGYETIDPLLQRTFPKSRIVHDSSRPYDLVVRSNFQNVEKTPDYTCPYITWSGESYNVHHKPGVAPLLEVKTSIDPSVENLFYFPHLVTEIPCTTRPSVIEPKRWCAAYAFSHSIPERELVFQTMRRIESTCYGFGLCSRTSDNPFESPRSQRGENGNTFSEFAFIIAMENKVYPGYITEKIGNAFNAGAVPIYWGHNETVNNFFNPAAFLNVLEYPSLEKAAETAVHVWRDPQKLQSYFDVPLLLNSTLRDYEAVRTSYKPWQAPFINKLRDAFPDQS